MKDNAKLYGKFLEQILWGFASATGHAPTAEDMGQIRGIAANLVLNQPEVRVVSVTVKDGAVAVVVDPPDERSLSA